MFHSLPDDCYEQIVRFLSLKDAVFLAACCRSVRESLKNCSKFINELASLHVPRTSLSALEDLCHIGKTIGLSWMNLQPAYYSITPHDSYTMGVDFNDKFVVSVGGINCNRLFKSRWEGDHLGPSVQVGETSDSALLHVRCFFLVS